MKTLSELRELFVGARNIAIEASPARAEEAATLLTGIADHARELFETETSYMERAKARNLYESLDNIIAILRTRGFCNEHVAAFFGLASGVWSCAPISVRAFLSLCSRRVTLTL